ncbi:hypothetical protein Tco_0289467 [Tanacetum coccineum]
MNIRSAQRKLERSLNNTPQKKSKHSLTRKKEKKYSNEIQARAFKAMQVMNLTQKGKTLENIASALNIDVKSVKQFVTFFYAFREIVLKRDYQGGPEASGCIGNPRNPPITTKEEFGGAFISGYAMFCAICLTIIIEMHLVVAPDPSTLIPALGLDMIPLFFFALAASLDKHSLLKEFFVWLRSGCICDELLSVLSFGPE